jgi:hypothetical protein
VVELLLLSVCDDSIRQQFLCFWHCPSSQFFQITTIFDTGSVDEWLRLTLSRGPNWVVVFPTPLTWGWKQIQFPKCRVIYFLEYFLHIVLHCQNMRFIVRNHLVKS